MALTPKEQAFVDAYVGDATAAAIAAGYSEKTAKQRGYKLMQKKAIRDALNARSRIVEQVVEAQVTEAMPAMADQRTARIASRLERQAFWTRVMEGHETETLMDKMGGLHDVPVSMKDRLKASELLGKSEADFTENLTVAADSSFAEALKAARERCAARR